ncbi:diguanylate cyclase [Shewanella baltica]|uniref:diguanylate cyclase n=1 Tax=Shewanella baltica TaxID=62322 RepID=UPI00014F8B49|nr:diguanylate cyclase [Shewanella baltica]ABS10320.1 response regulator receiver modulated diguanylate cyclase [Shewanella baltica OS185]
MHLAELIARPQSEKGKILIVDDQPLNIKILHQLFNEEYELFMATNGEQAIAICQKVQPDLVLLDIEMPGMSGFDVCQHLKADPETATIGVIFVTAHFDEVQEVKGFQLGAVDFIHKPINPIITTARVKNQFTLKRQSDLLHSIALLDSLTGVANRRQFEQRLPEIWKHCCRNELALSVVMLDVDFFKRFNDRYGHQEGDQCLRQVAKAISDSLQRATDFVARYGGEEFICILPETKLVGAIHTAQNIVNAVQALHLEHLESSFQEVTISAGVASVLPKSDLTWQTLIETADQQLYLAKESGRNQVVGLGL